MGSLAGAASHRLKESEEKVPVTSEPILTEVVTSDEKT